ncbi:hypothetical protein [Dethiothermospora halolimnae]|uniref:hypothetical protein n=1 Tax=Dethiothermospora halolimnae TaxID=3114390 RepID=UPI003CCBB772
MSKVILKHLDNKKLVCPLCDKDDEFEHRDNIDLSRDEPYVSTRYVQTDMIFCSCGWTMFLKDVEVKSTFWSDKKDKVNYNEIIVNRE